MNDETVTIEYQFRLSSGVERTFTVRLKKPTFEIISVRQSVLPEWTKLTHHQCSNCPLDPQQQARCPIAPNPLHQIDASRHWRATEEADITIRSESAEYLQPSP